MDKGRRYGNPRWTLGWIQLATAEAVSAVLDVIMPVVMISPLSKLTKQKMNSLYSKKLQSYGGYGLSIHKPSAVLRSGTKEMRGEENT
jgi:hypothetical protein